MKVDYANLVYGTRIIWAVQDLVPNKKSRIHFIKKLTGLWVNKGTRSVRKMGRLVKKSLRLGWVIGSSKHWNKKDHAEMSSFAHCACCQTCTVLSIYIYIYIANSKLHQPLLRFH